MDRCSEGARSLARYKGPVIWPTSNQGHIALPPRGSKRLGPQYWAGNSSDWLKLKNPGAPAVRRGPRKTV